MAGFFLGQGRESKHRERVASGLAIWADRKSTGFKGWGTVRDRAASREWISAFLGL